MLYHLVKKSIHTVIRQKNVDVLNSVHYVGRFGFGLLDAAALVNAADPAKFKTVPEKTICVIDSKDSIGMGLPKYVI